MERHMPGQIVFHGKTFLAEFKLFVILGKQCLHVLSKGTALHKAVGC